MLKVYFLVTQMGVHPQCIPSRMVGFTKRAVTLSEISRSQKDCLIPLV